MKYEVAKLLTHPDYHKIMFNGRVTDGGRHVEWDGRVAGVEPVTKPWPAWATALRALRRDGERGVGDTAERLFGSFGGQPFKMALRSAGIECGCDERKEKWNELYPYAKQELTPGD